MWWPSSAARDRGARSASMRRTRTTSSATRRWPRDDQVERRLALADAAAARESGCRARSTSTRPPCSVRLGREPLLEPRGDGADEVARCAATESRSGTRRPRRFLATYAGGRRSVRHHEARHARRGARVRPRGRGAGRAWRGSGSRCCRAPGRGRDGAAAGSRRARGRAAGCGGSPPSAPIRDGRDELRRRIPRAARKNSPIVTCGVIRAMHPSRGRPVDTEPTSARDAVGRSLSVAGVLLADRLVQAVRASAAMRRRRKSLSFSRREMRASAFRCAPGRVLGRDEQEEEMRRPPSSDWKSTPSRLRANAASTRLSPAACRAGSRRPRRARCCSAARGPRAAPATSDRFEISGWFARERARELLEHVDLGRPV